MLKKIILSIVVTLSLLVNPCQASWKYEQEQRKVRGTYAQRIQSDIPETQSFYLPENLDIGKLRNKSLLVQLLFIGSLGAFIGSTLAEGVTVPSSDNSDNFTSFNNITKHFPMTEEHVYTVTNQAHDSLISQVFPENTYFSVHQPIPLINRTGVFKILETRYMNSEACESSARSVYEQLSSIPNIKNMLENCDTIIDPSFLNPNKMKQLTVSFKHNSNFKLVDQGYYSVGSEGMIGTGNLMKCVGVSLFNLETKVGGVGHVSGETIRFMDAYLEGEEFTKTGFKDFMEEVIGDTEPSKIRVTLVSGSKAHTDYLQSFMEHFGLTKFKRFQKDDWAAPGNNYFNSDFKCGSLILNLENGKTYRARNPKLLSKKMGPTMSYPGRADRLIRQ